MTPSALILIQNFRAQNIRRHQVRRELHAAPIQTQHPRRRFHQSRLRQARRAHQQREWLWALVRGELEDALRTSTSVNAIRKDLEAQVERGDLSALEASDRILKAFATDAPSMWPEHPKH